MAVDLSGPLYCDPMDTLRAPLDAAALRDGLAGSGLPWRQIDVVTETGSTNADLIARAEGGADIDGSVLVAEYQNAGRGRHGRQWSAPPCAQIALSVGVGAASVPRTGWGWLPLATGVAVADALTELVNIGVSRAAASLRKMVGHQVLLSVPAVEVVTQKAAAALMSDKSMTVAPG